MSRLLLLLSCVTLGTGSATLALTAPVPTHLMPEDSQWSFPSRVGTRWVYEKGGEEHVQVITRVEQKDGGKLVTVESVDGLGTAKLSHQVLVGPNESIFRRGTPFPDGAAMSSSSLCFLKTKFKVGEEWKADVAVEGGLKIVMKMKVAAIERVKVPAGVFTAARVEWEYSPANGGAKAPLPPYWYAPGVGLVRLDDQPAMVLKSFTLGQTRK